MRLDMNAVETYLKDEFGHIHRIEDVAQLFGISGETLRKTFVRHKRISFSKYLNILRIEEMKRRLACTNQKCFEICYDVGFRREDSGAKAFKRYTGYSMEQFRRIRANQ